MDVAASQDGKCDRRDCLLGALGAALMLIGDLCLSVIPASNGDNGLFAREAYWSGSYPAWRLQVLAATGLLGMALAFFTVRAAYCQVLPQFKKTRRAVLIGGVIYLSSAAALHFWIGSLAEWTRRLSPIVGRETATALIASQYETILPSMLISYAGMALFFAASAFAILTRKTILPRRMFVFFPFVWQLVFMLIPDIRQACGAATSTWDFVLSQGSGNAALLVWMVANAVWARRQKTKGVMIDE